MHILKRISGLAIVGAVAGFLVAGIHGKRVAAPEAVNQPTNPVQFSLKDWKQALHAVKKAFGTKNLSSLAAGVAYFSTLSFFPLMAATVAIAALIISPDQLQHIVTTVNAYLPKDVASLITTQLQTLSGRHADNVQAAAIAIVVSLIGASGASKSLVAAANTAYEVKESRGWLMQQLEGLVWTLAGIIFGFVVAVVLLVNKTVLHHLGIFHPFDTGLLYGRWVLMVLIITLGLAVFYRYGPNRKTAQWQWISWGAVTTTVLWLAVTALFFVYVQNFAHYSQAYSLFAGIIVLMIWFNLSAFTILLGASVNHGLETAARTD